MLNVSLSKDCDYLPLYYENTVYSLTETTFLHFVVAMEGWRMWETMSNSTSRQVHVVHGHSLLGKTFTLRHNYINYAVCANRMCVLKLLIFLMFACRILSMVSSFSGTLPV